MVEICVLWLLFLARVFHNTTALANIMLLMDITKCYSPLGKHSSTYWLLFKLQQEKTRSLRNKFI